MEECFICRISDNKVRMFDAIHPLEGVVGVCEKCALDEHLPIIRRPTTFQLKEAERRQPVYERLARRAGIDPEKHLAETRARQEREIRSKRTELSGQEVSLKEIVEKNLKFKKSEQKKPREDLIDNFHWVIMMARRKKHMTREQLAEAISESPVIIEMVEKGMLPEDDYRIVNKLESYLDIKLRKAGVRLEPSKIPARIINFKPGAFDNLTIADLKRMKEAREGSVAEEFDKAIREEVGEVIEEEMGEEDEDL